MPFISIGDGDLKTAFVTNAWLIDQFVGNRLYLWGLNTNGKLGDNTIVSKSSPVQVFGGAVNWEFARGGYYHNSGIKTDGTYWSWGANSFGQLGDNTIVHRSSPVQTVSFGSTWMKSSSAGSHVAAIKTDGTLWLWGNNDSGQLGDNTITHRSSPVQTITYGNNWLQVSCGYNHTIATKTDGTLWTWGKNSYGQLGDNTTTSKSSPIQTITRGTNWFSISTSFYSNFAIKTDGTLWCWGLNGSPAPGILGDNSTINRSSPIQTVTGGTNWKNVGSFAYHVAAIKTDCTLWTWGRNSLGQLGDNSTTHRSSPVQTISGGNNWKTATGSGQAPSGSNDGHTVAIKTDGSLWVWGCNAQGQLGDNTTTNRSSPVQTILGGTTWKQVSASQSVTLAVTYGD